MAVKFEITVTRFLYKLASDMYCVNVRVQWLMFGIALIKMYGNTPQQHEFWKAFIHPTRILGILVAVKLIFSNLSISKLMPLPVANYLPAWS